MKPRPLSGDSLSGQILAARTHMLDPHFRQTLIYVVDHDENGAMGLVLNRPLGRTFGEVARHPELAEALSAVPVYMGGPVKAESLIMAMFSPGRKDSQIRCVLSTGLEQLQKFLAAEKGWVRAYAGYAGWTGGQLEEELARDAWKVCPFSRHVMDERLVQGLWPFFVDGDTRWHKLLAHLPRHPENN